MVTALARTMEKIHHDRGIAIDVHADEAARFRGERPDLEEMIGNLVDNACKWAASRVAIEVARERPDPPARPAVRIVVDDDGRGLSPAEREQVAKRGRRLDETKPGSGLGLSIVVELAGLYGGGLTLGAAPLGGLRAELVLPAAMTPPDFCRELLRRWWPKASFQKAAMLRIEICLTCRLPRALALAACAGSAGSGRARAEGELRHGARRRWAGR